VGKSNGRIEGGCAGESALSAVCEVMPREHLVQVYSSEPVFMDTLEAFAFAGLRRGEGVVVIATPEHRRELTARLRARGLDAEAARSVERLIELDASETLERFMVGGRPSEELFEQVVMSVLARALGGSIIGTDRRGGAPGVRAFGEMVALTWARGQREATLQLEQMWHRLCHREDLALLCAYPRASFPADDGSLNRICAAHSRVVHG